ncbi:MAG: Sensor protein [uncultured bacterium]|nr:MAG: Sensor protein [uncultured bacterium]
MQYESTINEALDDSKCIVLCRYDINSLNLQTFSDTLSTHPKVFIGTREFNNDDYYLTTDHFLDKKSEKLKINNWLKNIKNSYDNKKNLTKSNEIYSLLYSAMCEGVCIHEIIYDKYGNAIEYEILDVNPAYESITGLNKKDIIGKRACEVYKTVDPPYIEIYSKVVSTGNPITFETYFEPMKKYFHISTVCLGEKGKFATIFSDITDFVKLQKELKSAKEEAEVANELKSEFLANMSHEFRTPLNAIIGFTDMVLSGSYGKLSDKINQYLNNVSKSGKHLLNLVNALLDISKIEAGKADLIYENFNSKQIINEIILTFESMITLKSISLEVQLSNNNIDADMGKFKQIIYNLVGNAVKFTPEGGKVSVYSDINNGNLTVTIEDTGIGIAEQDRDKVFAEFKQISSNYGRKQEGTGLGLALTKRLIELHRGIIDFESEKDIGSKFWFSIPIQRK